MSLCQTLKSEYASLLTLKGEFDLEYQKAVETGNLDRAKELKAELEVRMKALKEKLHISVEKAAEIMKENFLGPEAIKKTFGFTPEAIPPIPFKQEELKRAKELNQILILQVSEDESKNPLTMKSMNEKVRGVATAANKLLYNIDWYKDELFFTNESVSSGWKLVSKEVIPETQKNKNYLEQTEILIDHLKTAVFENHPLPQEYEDAIAEFETEKAGIAAIIDSDWKKAGEMLLKLKITTLLKESAPDLLYRLILEDNSNNQKLLGAIYSWTKSRSSDGHLVSVGGFNAEGAYVDRDVAGYRYDYLGSVLSRVK